MAHMQWYKPVEESHEHKWYDRSLAHNPNHYGHSGGYVITGSHTQGYSNSYGYGQYPDQYYGQHTDGKNHGWGQSSHGLLGGQYSSHGTGSYGNLEKKMEEKYGHKEKHNHGSCCHGHGHGHSDSSRSDRD